MVRAPFFVLVPKMLERETIQYVQYDGVEKWEHIIDESVGRKRGT
jgi:hypothetical protein